MEERAEARSVTLYPQDWAVIQQVAKDTGQRSYSGGLRAIIAKYIHLAAREANIDELPIEALEQEEKRQSE